MVCARDTSAAIPREPLRVVANECATVNVREIGAALVVDTAIVNVQVKDAIGALTS